MEILPNNDNLKKDYKKYLELDKDAYIYDVEVIIRGEIPVEVDIENNSVLYYDGPKTKELKRRDIAFLKKYIKDEMLEDFYENQIKKIVLAIVMLLATIRKLIVNDATSIKFSETIYFECH